VVNPGGTGGFCSVQVTFAVVAMSPSGRATAATAATGPALARQIVFLIAPFIPGAVVSRSAGD
jgi:hypothetical protein